MKLNQKLLEQLRNDEITVENSGTLEQLKEVLKAAFPEHGAPPAGDCQYYSRSEINTDRWTGYSFKDKSKPTFKISDFYQPYPLPKFPKGGLVSELGLKPEPAILKPKCPHSLDFDLPKSDISECLPKTSSISKAKEIHNAYSDYKQLLKQKESIREALRECNTRIKEAENNLIKIINS